nr:hypothetical protein [Prescottella equi]NKZ87113.1 hypothetical protein [Prescottella equi]
MRGDRASTVPPHASDPASFAPVHRGYYSTLVALFTATLLILQYLRHQGVAFFVDQDVSVGPFQILPIITDGG